MFRTSLYSQAVLSFIQEKVCVFIFDFGGNGSRGKYRCPPATQARGMVHTSFITVQYRKWSPTANDPETANDPQNGPQVIPKVDRKWSRENLRNGMDFKGLITKKDWL